LRDLGTRCLVKSLAASVTFKFGDTFLPSSRLLPNNSQVRALMILVDTYASVPENLDLFIAEQDSFVSQKTTIQTQRSVKVIVLSAITHIL
jgi:hypothetical protein